MTKQIVIEQILANSVYHSQSGVMQRLVKVLNKLSMVDLNNLLLIIEIKELDATSRAKEDSDEAAANASYDSDETLSPVNND